MCALNSHGIEGRISETRGHVTCPLLVILRCRTRWDGRVLQRMRRSHVCGEEVCRAISHAGWHVSGRRRCARSWRRAVARCCHGRCALSVLCGGGGARQAGKDDSSASLNGKRASSPSTAASGESSPTSSSRAQRLPGAGWKRLRRRLADDEMRRPHPQDLLHAARYSCSRLGCGCQ